jgi:crossover junction endodeoxyribonuclease RuvC
LRVLGIDPGLGVTGYGLVDRLGSHLLPVEFGVIRSKGEFADRLATIHRALLDVVAQYSPDVLSIERVFQGPNVASLIKLAHARSAAMLAASLRGLPVFEYTPMQIKRAVTGQGGADKEQVRFMITKLLKLKEEPRPLDASDALATAICHLNQAAQAC